MSWTDGREIDVGNDVEALVDDEVWPELYRALRGARTSIDLSQLLFDVEFAPHAGRPLASLIEEAAERGVHVRILVNENAAIPDSVDGLIERFRGTSVTVRALAMSPNVLHAKIVHVDADEAFLVDPPFEQKYLDTQTHPFASPEPERGDPLHSVSLRLRGPITARIGRFFERLWAAPHHAPSASPEPSRAPREAGRETVQLAWTAPAGLVSDREETRILDAYLCAIQNAERYIYLETQYFTSPRLVDALGAALRKTPGPDIIIVLNGHMDVPTYDTWQARRLRELGWGESERLGIFSLWSPRRADPDGERRPVYVHSKVAIVDDVWATIGSANLDSISLHPAEEFLISAPPSVELNAIILDGVDDAPATGAVARLRRRLWGEHAGDVGAWREAPASGWLAWWNERAEANLAASRDGRGAEAGRVFPFGELEEGIPALASPRRKK